VPRLFHRCVEGPAINPSATLSRGLFFDAARHARLEAYVAEFRSVFHRADQFLRFRAYVTGLLLAGERKNVEAIASAAAAVIMVEANLAQALQHFVGQSPWNHGRLLAAVRGRSTNRRAGTAGVWVVHDGAFPKKGRHSVGVQRQFSRSAGRKLNCQLAVVVSHVGPEGYYPLATQLYLPAHWLRENQEVAERTVPEEFRRPRTKTEIALNLLDELRAEGPILPAVVAEGGYATIHEFRDGLANRNLSLTEAADVPVSEALRGFEWLKSELGLDHFEGRAWAGWHHHASLVFAAHGFLVEEAAREGSLLFPQSPPSNL
jgi:SRSO17 transposase